MRMKVLFKTICCLLVSGLFVSSALAAATSPYMGGDVKLAKAPNGAMVREEVLKSAQIIYTEPTTVKLTDGVWCIGGYSIANTTVIEARDGLIVYDTGDTREEAEHIRAAIKKISDKPIKAYWLCSQQNTSNEHGGGYYIR